jgi:hypothetical protein
VPRRSSAYRAPQDWLVSGTWPDGSFDPETPVAVAHAVAISVALTAALQGRNKSDVAKAAQIERSTLYDMLNGTTWPDTVTLANLEAILEVTLWPSKPPQLRSQRR